MKRTRKIKGRTWKIKGRTWKLVVYSADCDPEGTGLCPHCQVDFGECSCPGPTQDGLTYRTIEGQLWAAPRLKPGRKPNLKQKPKPTSGFRLKGLVITDAMISGKE